MKAVSDRDEGLNFPSIGNAEPVFDEAAPRMSMEEYLDFCDFMLGFADLEKVREQKEWEEQVEAAFRL